MANLKSGRRSANEINASSMADIAFLLLIFFLVTTTILQDQGIAVLLLPWSEEVLKQPPKNIFTIKVNAEDELLAEGEIIKVEFLKDKVKEFIINPNQQKHLASAPNKAVMSLQNDRETSYEMYIQVYNEIKAAYNELWNDLALETYGEAYSEELPIAYKRAIRSEIPFVVSESEPTDMKNMMSL